MALDKFIELAPNPRKLNDGHKYTVFLSYRSVNRSWVIALHDALVEIGHTVFIDQKELVPGQKLRQSIEEALMCSQAGVMVWSNQAADSNWVRDEYDVLRNRTMNEEDFYFVPIRLDSSQLPPVADAQLFIDFSSYPDGPNGGELMQLMHGIVGEPLSDEAMRFAQEISDATQEAEAKIKAALLAGDAEWLIELINTGGDAWEVTPQLVSKAIEALIRIEHHEDACEMAKNLVEQFPNAIRPKQMLAHIYTRAGSQDDVKNAQRILGELIAEGHRDPETLSLYAKTWFERYTSSGDTPESRDKQLLRTARNNYLQGFENSRDDTYCGINAATKSLIIGGDDEKAKATEIAKRVTERLPSEITPGMDYWDGATIAEATLIAGNVQQAAELYQKAIDLAPEETGSLKSTFRSVLDLSEQLNLTEAEKNILHSPFAHL